MKKRNLMSLGLAFCLGVPTVAILVTGCAGDRYSRSTGEYIDDKALAARVSSAIHDNPDYKLGDVEVKAFRGTVQLSGFVNTAEQKDRAGEIAKNVEGVRGVENNITVKTKLSDNR